MRKSMSGSDIESGDNYTEQNEAAVPDIRTSRSYNLTCTLLSNMEPCRVRKCQLISCPKFNEISFPNKTFEKADHRKFRFARIGCSDLVVTDISEGLHWPDGEEFDYTP